MIRVIKNVFWIAVIGLIIGWGYYNYLNNNSFFQAPLYSILNVFIILSVSYYLTQRRNDQRKIKETLEKIIDKIQIEINDKNAYIINSDVKPAELTNRNRSINNRIGLLASYEKQLKISDELNVIKERFKEYEDIIGCHFSDIQSLSGYEFELKTPLQLIDTNLENIRLKLYK